MRKIKLWAMCMIIAVVSFLGFVVENIWLSVTQGCMNNRSMFFPFLIGYGLAIVLIYVLLGTPQNLCVCGKVVKCDSKRKKVLLYLCAVMVCVSLGEILLGTLVEKVCGFVWWDYTKLPLHITKYTSVPTSFVFGTLITVFMNYFFVPLLRFFEGWNPYILKYAAILLITIMVGDFLYAAYQMFLTHGTLIRWEIITNSWLYKKTRKKLRL